MVDSISSLDITLADGTSLTGTIDGAATAKSASLALVATSTWTVTADSYLTVLVDPDGISGTSIANTVGNGHTVYHDASASANSGLASGTYALVGGGTLTPAGWRSRVSLAGGHLRPAGMAPGRGPAARHLASLPECVATGVRRYRSASLPECVATGERSGRSRRR